MQKKKSPIRMPELEWQKNVQVNTRGHRGVDEEFQDRSQRNWTPGAFLSSSLTSDYYSTADKESGSIDNTPTFYLFLTLAW
jgi:hypothetical protein